MDKEVIFGQTLEKIRKKAKEEGGVIAPEEVARAFASFSLDEDQLTMIHEYLRKRGIGIGRPADPEEVLDAEEREYLKRYLREVSKAGRLGENEREALMLSAMAGKREAIERLIADYLPQVADIARLYARQGVTMEDLVGEGNVALVSGMEMLGALEEAGEAQRMLVGKIMDAMDRLVAEHALAGVIGKQAAERVNRIADAAKELSDALGRKVTVQELSGESGISGEEIQEALRLSGGKIEEIEDGDGRGKQGF